MRRFRQKLYRTRIGARQKQPFLNHLQLIINFFTCFSQTTLEKLSLIGAARSQTLADATAGAVNLKVGGNHIILSLPPAAKGVRGKALAPAPVRGAKRRGFIYGAGLG